MPIPPRIRVLDENQRPLPFTIQTAIAPVLLGRARRGQRAQRRPRDGLLAHASRCRRSGVAAPGQCPPRDPSRRRDDSPPPDIWPWLAGWEAWDCCSIGCCSDAAGSSACARRYRRLVRRASAKGRPHDLRSRLGSLDRMAALGLGGLGMERTRRRLALALKALSLLAILLALAEPRLKVNETRVAVAVLVDTSASVSPADLTAPRELARSMQSAQGRHWMRVVPFARSTRTLESNEQQQSLDSAPHRRRSRPRHRYRSRACAKPSPPCLPAWCRAWSDFRRQGEQRQHRARGLAGPAARHSHRHLRAGRPAKPALRLDSISLPSIAFTGEQFPIDLVVSAPQAGSGRNRIGRGRPVAGQDPGPASGRDNPVRMHASLNTPGALDLSIASSLRRAPGEVRFEQAVTMRKPKVLYISGDDPDAGFPSSRRRLQAAQFDLDRNNDFRAPRLNDYQLVIFNDWDLEAIPPALQGRDGAIREAGRRPAGDRRRTQHLPGRQNQGRRARPRSSRHARAAAIA